MSHMLCECYVITNDGGPSKTWAWRRRGCPRPGPAIQLARDYRRACDLRFRPLEPRFRYAAMPSVDLQDIKTCGVVFQQCMILYAVTLTRVSLYAHSAYLVEPTAGPGQLDRVVNIS